MHILDIKDGLIFVIKPDIESIHFADQFFQIEFLKL